MEGVIEEVPASQARLGVSDVGFYNGFTFGAKQLADASAGGSTYAKTPQQVYDLIEWIAMNSYTWGAQGPRQNWQVYTV